MKNGTLYTSTNFKEWVHYKPRRGWLDSLHEEGKVSHARYLELAAHFPAGYATRKRDIDEIRRDENDAVVQALVDREKADLKLDSWQDFEEVKEFEAHFASTPRHRRPILAIVGPTNSGKSLLGGAILQRLATAMGLPGFLEITVEGDEELDLRDFRVSRGSGILLDGVGDVNALKQNREILQGRPKVVKGGRSATMIYSYNFTLCRRAVVATLDLSAANLHMLTTDHWMKNRKNVILLRLQGPAWAATHTPTETVSPEAQMKGWGVKEVGDFLRGADLQGPASACEANGVDGRDLFAMEAITLREEVRLSPFAARKVVSARDVFLSAS